MEQLVKIEDWVLDRMASSGLASSETIQPFLPDFKKSTIQSEANKVILNVLDGNMSALEAHLFAKALIKISADIIKETLKHAETEAATYEKNSGIKGAKFSIANVPDIYDFDFDLEYYNLQLLANDRKQMLKEAIKSNGTIIDNDGIEVPKCPIKTFGGTTIKVEFK
jgi:Tol biopolymer transport system component